MAAYVILALIFCAVVLAGASVTVLHMPASLGRRRLPALKHHPDYQKIAQLERELGLSNDPRVIIDPDGTTRVVDRGLSRPSPRAMPAAPDPEFQVPDPDRPLINDRPPMFKTYDDYMAYLRAKNPPPKE